MKSKGPVIRLKLYAADGKKSEDDECSFGDLFNSKEIEQIWSFMFYYLGEVKRRRAWAQEGEASCLLTTPSLSW